MKFYGKLWISFGKSFVSMQTSTESQKRNWKSHYLKNSIWESQEGNQRKMIRKDKRLYKFKRMFQKEEGKMVLPCRKIVFVI